VVNHEMACSMDLFNTCLLLGGATVPTDRPQDGVDMAPMLMGKGPSQRNLMFFYRTDKLYAVRKGAYKLHMTVAVAYSDELPKDLEKPLLYQLENDPGERFDVAAEHPEIVADILREIEKHKKGVVPGKPQF
jgi:arylsulfatase A